MLHYIYILNCVAVRRLYQSMCLTRASGHSNKLKKESSIVDDHSVTMIIVNTKTEKF